MARVRINDWKTLDHASKFGFDPEKTYVHGTRYREAKQIQDSKRFNNGTIVPANRAGFEVTSEWALQTKGPTRVIAMMELEEPVEGSTIQVGKRALEHGEGSEKPIKLKKVKILRINSKPSADPDYGRIPVSVTDEYSEPYKGYNKDMKKNSQLQEVRDTINEE